MDAGVGHQVGLELRDIDVQGTIEAERCSERRDNLGNQSVKVGVGGSLNVKVAAAHVVQGLVIQAEGAVGVFQEGVRRQHVVVGFNDGGGDLGGWGHGERQLGLTAVVDGKALEQERAETGSSSSTGGVEDQEALETSAVVGQLAEAVKHKVDDLLADGVVTTGVVVGGILLAGDELLRVVELAVGASADFVAHSRLQVDEDSTGDVLAGTGLREESVEGVIAATNSLVGGHLAIRLDAVLKAVKFPAGISGLDTSLTNVYG